MDPRERPLLTSASLCSEAVNDHVSTIRFWEPPAQSRASMLPVNLSWLGIAYNTPDQTDVIAGNFSRVFGLSRGPNFVPPARF